MKAITGQNPVEQVVYPHKGVTLAQADVSFTVFLLIKELQQVADL